MKTLICSQAKLNDSTEPIHFNEYGKRKGIELDILNLRNNSFQKVSNDFLNSYVHEVVFQKLCYHRLHLSVQNIMCAWPRWFWISRTSAYKHLSVTNNSLQLGKMPRYSFLVWTKSSLYGPSMIQTTDGWIVNQRSNAY